MADILCQMYFLSAILKIMTFVGGSIAEHIVLYMSDICTKIHTYNVTIYDKMADILCQMWFSAAILKI